MNRHGTEYESFLPVTNRFLPTLAPIAHKMHDTLVRWIIHRVSSLQKNFFLFLKGIIALATYTLWQNSSFTLPCTARFAGGAFDLPEVMSAIRTPFSFIG